MPRHISGLGPLDRRFESLNAVIVCNGFCSAAVLSVRIAGAVSRSAARGNQEEIQKYCEIAGCNRKDTRKVCGASVKRSGQWLASTCKKVGQLGQVAYPQGCAVPAAVVESSEL